MLQAEQCELKTSWRKRKFRTPARHHELQKAIGGLFALCAHSSSCKIFPNIQEIEEGTYVFTTNNESEDGRMIPGEEIFAIWFQFPFFSLPQMLETSLLEQSFCSLNSMKVRHAGIYEINESFPSFLMLLLKINRGGRRRREQHSAEVEDQLLLAMMKHFHVNKLFFLSRIVQQAQKTRNVLTRQSDTTCSD